MTDRDSSKPLTDAELGRLDELLQRLVGDSGVSSLSMLDGYLTAAIIAPPEANRTSWMDDFCGEPIAEVLESGNLGEVPELAMRYYSKLAEQLLLGRGYSPRLAPIPGDPEARDPQPWCAGFLRAMDLDPEVWDSIIPSIGEPLSAIVAFGTQDGQALIEGFDEQDRVDLAESLSQAVTAIHDATLMMYDPEPYMPSSVPMGPTEPYHAPPKVGRNEPCPCGSGRKYKKCCRP